MFKEYAIERSTDILDVSASLITPRNREDALTLARMAVEAAADKKAENIILLDVRKLSSIADYFVICSGVVDRQLEAIAEHVQVVLRNEFMCKPRHIEGDGDAGWVLVDYVDVIIHVFTPSLRSYYNLEGLWASAPVLLRMQ